MQLNQNLPKENNRLSTTRKSNSYQDILKENDTASDKDLQASSCTSNSQPDLAKDFKQPVEFSKRFSSGRPLRESMRSIPVRETYASRLRKTVSSTDRTLRNDGIERNISKYFLKPKWQSSNKIHHKVNTMIHVAKIKKPGHSAGSETSSNSSKFDKEEESDLSRRNDIDFTGVQLVPHSCKHGNFVEVKFPLEKQKTSTTFPKPSHTDVRDDVRFVINAHELCDIAPQSQVEKPVNDNKMIDPNEHVNPIQPSQNSVHATETDISDNLALTNMNIDSNYKTKLSSLSSPIDSSDGEKPIIGACIDDKLCSNVPQDSCDDGKDLSPDESTVSWNINQAESHIDKGHVELGIGDGEELGSAQGKTNKPFNRNVSMHSQSKLCSPVSKIFKEGITITSKKYRNLDDSYYENESPSKIPYFVGSTSTRKRSLSAKAKCAVTLNESPSPVSKLSNSLQKAIQKDSAQQYLKESEALFGYPFAEEYSTHNKSLKKSGTKHPEAKDSSCFNDSESFSRSMDEEHIEIPALHCGKTLSTNSRVETQMQKTPKAISSLNYSAGTCEGPEEHDEIFHKLHGTEYSNSRIKTISTYQDKKPALTNCKARSTNSPHIKETVSPKLSKAYSDLNFSVGKVEDPVKSDQDSSKFHIAEFNTSRNKITQTLEEVTDSRNNFHDFKSNSPATLLTKSEENCSSCITSTCQCSDFQVLDDDDLEFRVRATGSNQEVKKDVLIREELSLFHLVLLIFLTVAFSCIFAFGNSITFELVQGYIDYFMKNVSEIMFSSFQKK